MARNKNGGTPMTDTKQMAAAMRGDQRAVLIELGDRLAMFASMIKEHCEDTENGLPSVARLDDWLVEYRDATGWYGS